MTNSLILSYCTHHYQISPKSLFSLVTLPLKPLFSGNSPSSPSKTHQNHRFFTENSPSFTGWWYTYPSEKCEFVRWGYYSQYMESHKIPWFQSPPTSFLRLSAPARLSSWDRDSVHPAAGSAVALVALPRADCCCGPRCSLRWSPATSGKSLPRRSLGRWYIYLQNWLIFRVNAGKCWYTVYPSITILQP